MTAMAIDRSNRTRARTALLNSTEFLEALASLNAQKGGRALAATLGHLIHELQVHQAELEAQNQELRQAQQALESSRHRYANLYDLAPIGYLSLSHHGLVLESNLAGAAMLGQIPAAVVNHPFVRFVAKEGRQLFLDHLFRCRNSGRATTDLTIVPRDYVPFHVQLFSVAIKDPNHGRVLLTAMSDINERVKATEALHVAYDELENRVQERTKALVEANEALENASQRKDEFLAMLGHELRNPLASVVTAAYLLKMKEPEDSATFAWATETISSQAEQLQRLIDDLLDVSRVSRGKIALRRKCLSLSGVVAATVEASRPRIEQRQLHFSLGLPEQPVWAEVDPARLTQVVANLLDNAMKFTAPGGSIELEVGTENGDAFIRLRDTGEGIAPELLPHIFEPFSQADKSLARHGAGLGIGLSLVKGLVGLHGGRVSAASEGIGKGAEFVVRLPALKQAPAIEEPAEVQHRKPVANTRRILLAEDNVAAAEALAELLQHFDHSVTVAHDGVAALVTARTELPEVAILDIGLPEMDGYTLARKLRELPGGDGPLLIAITGYGGDNYRLQSHAAGFDHHLVKPVNVDDLLELIDIWGTTVYAGQA
jgi:PAS domain S-box-containing protein